MSRSLPCTIVLSLCASLSACHIGFSQDITVDGLRLTAKHEQVLSLPDWPVSGLVIEAHMGDLRVEFADEPTTLIVLLHEREPNVARADIEDGRLVARTADGTPCAIGRVLVRTRGPALGLTLETGMGDVVVRGVRVEGDLKISTGMGDVQVEGTGEVGSISLSTGMGNVEVGALECARIEAETGMGNIHVAGIEAREAELSSGMGNVEVERSKGSRVKAESGLGDVVLSDSSFEVRDLETGLGRVKER